MTKVRFPITMSLDGYAAGPDQKLDNPLGDGGVALHDWRPRPGRFAELLGLDGGATGIDDERAASWNTDIGASVMGRNMFGPDRGPWPDERLQRLVG